MLHTNQKKKGKKEKGKDNRTKERLQDQNEVKTNQEKMRKILDNDKKLSNLLSTIRSCILLNSDEILNNRIRMR